MLDFFEKKVEKVSKKSLRFFLVIFIFILTLLVIQIAFVFILKGNHSYTWMLIESNPSNTVLWILSGIILVTDILSVVYIIFYIFKKLRNPMIYKSNVYAIIWVFLIFVINILIPNLIPVNYIFPVIAIIVGSTSTVLL